ncbi:hypothetical protein AUF62_00625 [archaeon 13_1_20CM_52_20]|nr:MAG: hypothetical protein AUF62_00625 [archaeon 13_1_20CM_52_20]
MKGAICKSCFKEIEDGEPWHFRYSARAGLLEPVHDGAFYQKKSNGTASLSMVKVAGLGHFLS